MGKVLNPREKAISLCNGIEKIISIHIYSGYYDIVVELAKVSVKNMLNSFNETTPHCEHMQSMEWTTNDTFLFEQYDKYWNNVLKELDKLK